MRPLACLVLSIALTSPALSQIAPGGTVGGTVGGPGAVQRPGMPPRDRPGAAPTGTARIRGRIVSAETGAPLRRAQVTLFSAEGTVRRVTTSDAYGRYEFGELPAGRFTISANKGGYVGLQYGQRRPLEPGTPVVLADGQTSTGINLTLPKGGVIAGRILDEFGEPIAGAQAQAQRYQYGADGQRRLQQVNGASSDDLGQFRVYGLMPGEYVISASAGGSFTMIGSGGDAVSDVNTGYAPTFYPGTLNVNEAQTITVAVGQETPIQFSLQTARMGRVSGTVVDSSGKPVSGAMLMLRYGSPTMGMTRGGGQTTQDGSFSLVNVPPGDYSIDVRPSPRPGNEGGEFASVPITIAGSDVTGLRITTGRGATISGRVIFQGQSPRTDGPNPLRVFLQQSDPSRMSLIMGGDPRVNGIINDDGTFQLNAGSGEVLFRPMTPQGWVLKSVTLAGEDITDVPYELTGKETISGVRIVLTDRQTNISGRVTDARGQAVKDYVVILQPAERREGIVLTRFLRTARGDQDGQFRVRGLPSGNYVATAVESLEQGRHFVPEVQSALRQSGRSFSVAEGATVVVDLKLTLGF